MQRMKADISSTQLLSAALWVGPGQAGHLRSDAAGPAQIVHLAMAEPGSIQESCTVHGSPKGHWSAAAGC